MIRRSLAIVVWLVVGHAALGGLYWALLQTPESNAFMLAVSALLVVLMVFWTGIVEGVGLLGWQRMSAVPELLWRVVRRSVWVLPALVVFGAVWWVTGAILSTAAGRAGEMDAWFIAHAGWVRTGWIHAAIEWVLLFVRYAVGGALALGLLAAGLRAGWSGVSKGLRRSLSWRTLAVVGVAVLAMAEGPWQLVYWRPSGLPDTWVQPAFAGTKLLVLFALMNALWAVALWAVGHEPGTAAPPPAVDAAPEAPAAEEPAAGNAAPGV